MWLKTLNARFFLGFELLFGQELLGFGQQNLILCLSEVDKKIFLLLWISADTA